MGVRRNLADDSPETQSADSRWRCGRRCRNDIVGKDQAGEGGGGKFARRGWGKRRDLSGGNHFLKLLDQDGGGNRCDGLAFDRFASGFDLAAKMAGFFAAERVFGRLDDAAVLGVGDEHADPRVNLHQRIRPARQLEAAEEHEQELERLLQGDLTVVEAQGREGFRKGETGRQDESANLFMNCATRPFMDNSSD